METLRLLRGGLFKSSEIRKCVTEQFEFRFNGGRILRCSQPSISTRRCSMQFAIEGLAPQEERSSHVAIAHRTSAIKNSKFCCSLCGHQYTNNPNLWRHLSNEHKMTNSNFRCLLCSNCFRRLSDLYSHSQGFCTEGVHAIILSANNNKYECLRCASKFRTIQDLDVHDLEVHLNQSEDLVSCPHCFVRRRSSVLYHHVREFHAEGNRSQRKRIFRKETAIVEQYRELNDSEYVQKAHENGFPQQHMTTVHNSGGEAASVGLSSKQQETNICSQCNAHFDTRFAYTKHMLLVHDIDI